MKISIIVGSEGKNLDLARQFETYLKSKNVEVRILDIVKMNLPLYTSAIEGSVSASDLVSNYSKDLACDGFVFLSPEYNGSTSPAFTNFIAWVSRSTKNWREHFNTRPAAIGSANGGGTNVLTVMRIQLAHLGMNVLGRAITVNPSKPADEAAIAAICDQLISLSSQK